MKKIISITAMTLILCSCGLNDSSIQDSGTVEKTFFAMDTSFSFKGSESDSAIAEKLLSELDSQFSRYNTESSVYAINSRSDSEPDEYTKEIITEACELSGKYGNTVSIFAGDITDCWNINSENPTVPSDDEINSALSSFRNADFSLSEWKFADDNGSVDLGSVGKGYALDKLREQIGGDYCIVSANSSILLNGQKSDGSQFSVAIRDPENGGTLGVLHTDEGFISTSGGYERYFEADGVRYSHIFNLNTGKPCETDLTSVTVICDSGIESDFLSTYIYIGGTSCLDDFIDRDDMKIIAVTDGGEVITSSEIDFEITSDDYKFGELYDE
jgi:thiamine biosynthesis lipoprotein